MDEELWRPLLILGENIPACKALEGSVGSRYLEKEMFNIANGWGYTLNENDDDDDAMIKYYVKYADRILFIVMRHTMSPRVKCSFSRSYFTSIYNPSVAKYDVII